MPTAPISLRTHREISSPDEDIVLRTKLTLLFDCVKKAELHGGNLKSQRTGMQQYDVGTLIHNAIDPSIVNTNPDLGIFLEVADRMNNSPEEYAQII